jgi:hypothetical protein
MGRKMRLIVAALLCFLGIASLAPALPRDSSQASQAAVILLLDRSGSMTKSDPRGLRCTALRMFLSLLDNRDSAAVIEFSTASEALTAGIVPLASHRNTLLHQFHSCPGDGYTDMKAAFEAAQNMLSAKAREQGEPVSLVLLTDGKPEIEKPYPGYEQEVLDLAHSLGAPIYAIALTSAADLNFLSQLTAGTGGYVIRAGTSSDLMDAYLQVLSAIKDRTVIGQGMSAAAGDVELMIEPSLVPYIEKATFVLSKPDAVSTSLMAPDGSVVQPDGAGVETFSTEDTRFLVVTVRQPMAGAWTFRTSGNGSVQARAILYSRLRVQLVSPFGFHEAGQPVPFVVRLVEEQADGSLVRIIGDAAFSAEIIRPDGAGDSLDRFYDDGTHGDQVAGDGDFTRLYPDSSLPGRYRIAILGRKGPVPVDKTFTLDVVQFPNLVIDSPQGAYEFRDQSLTIQAHLEGGQPTALSTGELVAYLTAPSGKRQAVPLFKDSDIYTAQFNPQEDGSYSIRVETESAAYLGVEYRKSVSGEFTVRMIHEVAVDDVQADVIAGCFDRTLEVSLYLTVTSLRDEALSFTIEDLDGFSLLPREASISSGWQFVVLTLRPVPGSPPAAGEYFGSLYLSGQEALHVTPSSSIPLHFAVPSLWRRCDEPISWGVAGLSLLVLTTAGLTRRLRAASMPPHLTGTLKWWDTDGSPVNSQELDLTSLKKHSIVIGSQEGCDLRLSAAGVEEQHAILQADKDADGILVYLQPLAMVRKGYSTLRARTVLSHADTFQVGTLNFQYLSDSGE